LEHSPASLSRRQFLGTLAAGAGAAAAATLLGDIGTSEASTAPDRGLNHLAWVWQWADDGKEADIRTVLKDFGMGILLKTHDGTTWMGKYDNSGRRINGPRDIQSAANYFESAGVPFHAWCVVKGTDVMTEAYMAAEVLSAGARSLTFDLEPPEGIHYWHGEDDDAKRFGEVVRRLQPNAWLGVAPDPRPWQLDAVPMAEFAAFTNEIMPQTYWSTFNSSANHRLLREFGHEVGPEGVTPELILDVTRSSLRRYGRPIRPVGQGASSASDWRRFVSHSYDLGMESVSVWRYGTATPEIFPLLKELKPKQPPPPRIAETSSKLAPVKEKPAAASEKFSSAYQTQNTSGLSKWRWTGEAK
jgi:hypothetical protein